MNLLQTLIYGFFGGLSDILPVSAQAHGKLFLTIFGLDSEPALLRLLIHIGIFAALYINCTNHILRISRAYRLSRVPKRRRTRPLDTNSLMDLRVLQTMAIPLIFGFIFYGKFTSLVSILSVLAWVVFLNGVVLYLPQFFPGSNKNALSISPFDSLLMGLGATLSLIPGVSCIGMVTAVASVRGTDRNYALNMALLLNGIVMIGLGVYDVIELVSSGVGSLSFGIFMSYLLAAAASFGGALLGIFILKKLAATRGFGIFALYCWGLSMLIFILFLSV